MVEIIPMAITVSFTIETDNGETLDEVEDEVVRALETNIHMIGGQEITYSVKVESSSCGVG